MIVSLPRSFFYFQAHQLVACAVVGLKATAASGAQGSSERIVKASSNLGPHFLSNNISAHHTPLSKAVQPAMLRSSFVPSRQLLSYPVRQRAATQWLSRAGVAGRVSGQVRIFIFPGHCSHAVHANPQRQPSRDSSQTPRTLTPAPPRPLPPRRTRRSLQRMCPRSRRLRTRSRVRPLPRFR